MPVWTSARWALPHPESHSFSMAKYSMIRAGVIARGLLPAESLVEPDPVSTATLPLVHDRAYVEAVVGDKLSAAELRRLGFPWSPALPERSRRTVRGSIEAARDALDTGAEINLAGGTHHAFPDHGEGFCAFNYVFTFSMHGARNYPFRREQSRLDVELEEGCDDTTFLLLLGRSLEGELEDVVTIHANTVAALQASLA